MLSKRVQFGLRIWLALCFMVPFIGYLPAGVMAQSAIAAPPPPEESFLLSEMADLYDSRRVALASDEGLQAELLAFERAYNEGPQAVIALRDRLSPEALDIVMDDIQAAEMQLAAAASPELLALGAVTPEEEFVHLQAAHERDVANRARALSAFVDPAEGQGELVSLAPRSVSPQHIAADLTVGAGCAYASIGAALAAAQAGDRLLIEGGRIFTENLYIPISVTLSGGYSGCASGSTDVTTIDGGSVAQRVIDIAPALEVTLSDLKLANGSATTEGGGIRFAPDAGSGSLWLNDVTLFNNTARYGGGVWVGVGASVIGTDVQVYSNTATALGGGIRLFGGQATFTNTNIYENIAANGAGVYATTESGFTPKLNLPSYADVYNNRATFNGGGIYFSEGVVDIADCSDISDNESAFGGGAYLVTTTLTMQGGCSEIQNNSASQDGGGAYVQGGTINLQNLAEVYANFAGTAGTGNGGGLYLDNSVVWGDMASVISNQAASNGGGIYAINNSDVDFDLGAYSCVGTHCSRISFNTATGGYGGGVYANASAVDLRNVFIEVNTASVGGGTYALTSSFVFYNNLFARNNSASTGDAIRLFTNSNLVGNGNTLAYNDAGGASSGTAIAMRDAEMTLGCSLIWGHATSINSTSGTNTVSVTYSDIEGGLTGTGNIDVDPQFVASGSNDYHLSNASPLIDRCSSFSGMTTDFENERRPIRQISEATPYDMGADEFSVPRVGINGAGCAYGTLTQALEVAADGDSLQVAGGTFYENVLLEGGKTLTVTGGYDAACTASGTEATVVNGSMGTSSVFYVKESTLLLRDMEITAGNTSRGGGLELSGAAQITLDNTRVHHNQATFGGGVYISEGSALTLTNNSDVDYNTATDLAGGVRVYAGRLVGLDTQSDIAYNSAPDGGGVAVTEGGVLYLRDSDLYQNQATDAAGRGGAVLLRIDSLLDMGGNSFIYWQNQAYDGAGIYADNSRVYIQSGTSTFRENVATHNGGAIYLSESVLEAYDARIGQAGSTLANQALLGAGIFAITSTVNLEGRIVNNVAEQGGGGIYAETSTLNLLNTQVGGTEEYESNQLSASGGGAGIYLDAASHATLSNTVVASNTFQADGFGGGFYIEDSSVLTLTNSRVERHEAMSSINGRGAGLYVSEGHVILDNSQILSNTARFAGGGIRLYGAFPTTLTMMNDSVISNNAALFSEGGGIAAKGSAVNITISDAVFNKNEAAFDGGAILVDGGKLAFDGSLTLRSNDAGRNGGALSANGDTEVDFALDSYSLIYNNQAVENGGAIYLANNDVVNLGIESAALYVYANSANDHGGAIYVGGDADLDIRGTVNFDHNSATTGNGGALYVDKGRSLSVSMADLTPPTFWANRAYSGDGGALYAADGATLSFDRVAFGKSGSGNFVSAGNGGALYLSGSALECVNCSYLENQAAGNGGAIAAYTSTLAFVADGASCDLATTHCSSFSGNVADSDGDTAGNGGAIYGEDNHVDMYQTFLDNNAAVRGGAIFYTGMDSHANISNTLMYSNTVSEAYGAAVRTEAGVSITATHVTMANNNGGAAFSPSSSTASVSNSIAWGNSAGGFVRTYVYTDCNIDQSSKVGLAVDPEFLAPGAGENYRLAAGSPALDACAAGADVDLVGGVRPVGAAYDMGAYESALALAFAAGQSRTVTAPLTVAYTHWLTHAGGLSDDVTLAASSDQGWAVAVDPAAVVLTSGMTIPVTVTLSVPADVISGTVDTTVVTATPLSDPSVAVSLTDTTLAYTSTLPVYTLSLQVFGNGAVTLTPSQTSYISGTVVQLEAVPGIDANFAGWDGDLSGSELIQALTMDADKTVTATFAEYAVYLPLLLKSF